jgi:transglutaminase-like putative cysteine protease
MADTTVLTDGRARSTGPLMERMVQLYYCDMVPYAHLSFREVYDIIKTVPYRPDPPHVETLMRPYLTLRRRGTGGDCDDKCIALGSYCRLKQIPCRFVAVRKRGKKNLHHVMCECYIGSKWIVADPTYAFNTLGREREGIVERVTIGQAYP